MRALTNAEIHLLANRLSIRDQRRAGRLLNARLSATAARDWALPLLHRCSWLLEAIRRGGHRYAAAFTVTTPDGAWVGHVSTSHYQPTSIFYVDVTTPSRSAPPATIVPAPPYGQTSYLCPKQQVLAIIDWLVHEHADRWVIELEDFNEETMEITYRPPMYDMTVPAALSRPSVPRNIRPRIL